MDGMLLSAPGDGLVDYDKLKTTLRDIQNAEPKNVSVILQQLPQGTGDEFLDTKLEAVKYLTSPLGNVSSAGDGNMSDVIQEIQMYIEGKSEEQSKEKAANPPANPPAQMQPAMASSFNWVRYSAQPAAQANPASKKKKKTKANPFRVLMGMVGKLLDHGVPKPTVVRHVTKNTSFDEPTVDRAVDIVREYNRKKQRQEDDPEIQMEEGKPAEKKVESSFNYLRYIEAQKATSGDAARELYTAEPQWEKRSTAELFSRLQWLNSLMNYDVSTRMGDGRKAADKQGANGQMDKITSELKRRGFSQAEVDSLLIRGHTED